jgi:hypothetical protein
MQHMPYLKQPKHKLQLQLDMLLVYMEMDIQHQSYAQLIIIKYQISHVRKLQTQYLLHQLKLLVVQINII